jgi:hypothetical protein
MASDKQLIANRLNARRSTGPRTIAGKLRSRRNAVKHGLTARAVVDVFEDEAEFRSFFHSIASGYSPRSQTDQEMVHRLASLLWRLRRAHAVETGLLGIQGKLQRDIRLSAEYTQQDMFRLFGLEDQLISAADPVLLLERQRTEAKARAFLRLCNINGGALDRLSRYEVSLWRQAAQVMLLLDCINSAVKGR